MYHIEPYKDWFPSSTIMPPEKLLLVRVKPLAEIRLCWKATFMEIEIERLELNFF